MAFNKKTTDEIISDINMTPLIDVMLVLLIIFMVSSSIAVDNGLDIRLPETKSKARVHTSTSIVIAMSEKGEITIDGDKTSIKSLGKSIRDFIIKKDTGLVLFKGDQGVSLKNIIKVMDIAKSNGATRFAIATASSN